MCNNHWSRDTNQPRILRTKTNWLVPSSDRARTAIETPIRRGEGQLTRPSDRERVTKKRKRGPYRSEQMNGGRKHQPTQHSKRWKDRQCIVEREYLKLHYKRRYCLLGIWELGKETFEVCTHAAMTCDPIDFGLWSMIVVAESLSSRTWDSDAWFTQDEVRFCNSDTRSCIQVYKRFSLSNIQSKQF